ncbi:AraC family transcriptional regulator [Zestomonas carbonaria]|uniref:Putative HTH-type transcriptional regulator n=1 Tax=Zestomonas carbonaria TaxID=2762745 RepID=A0A7U7IAD1_9GAMM|nr:AraC family transcriptional regulator [Pseudomonas carbonaria]CAD5109344.1 putative HTH-type transcriptional regulator [Pseudomonas carbonaria]
MRERTIASHFVRAALRGAERQGYDTGPLLAELNIRPELLSEPRARVTPEQFARLVQRVWEELDDEYMGFGRQCSKRGTFAMMCHSIIHCETLDKALNRGTLFYGLFPEAPLLHLERDGDQARLVLDTSDLWDPDHFLTESLLVLWHRLGSWLVGQRIRLLQATFTYAEPPHASEYDLLFPGARQFHAPRTSLLFQARYLDMPLLQDERTLKQFLKNSPADLLARPDGGDSLTSQIRRLLGRDCSHWPDLEHVARQLHTSPQTLRRHLREEGTSFQELKDHLRRDLAIYHLGRDSLAIQDIAAQLGFSEPSAFHRAFKKWTGLTPGAYRTHQAD